MAFDFVKFGRAKAQPMLWLKVLTVLGRLGGREVRDSGFNKDNPPPNVRVYLLSSPSERVVVGSDRISILVGDAHPEDAAHPTSVVVNRHMSDEQIDSVIAHAVTAADEIIARAMATLCTAAVEIPGFVAPEYLPETTSRRRKRWYD